MRGLIALALAALVASGCGRPLDPWETRGDRILGLGSERAEDPVSGKLVDKKDAIQREYRGATYFFESSETAEIFARHPEEYAVFERETLDGRADVR